MISKEERAELREIVASVTLPLPWKSDSDGVIVSDLYDFVADCDGTGGDFIDPKPARLIAGAVNALPKTLDALDAADERIAGLEAKVAETDRLFASQTAKVVREYLNKEAELKARIAALEAEKDEYKQNPLIVLSVSDEIGTLKARIAELEEAEEARIAEEKRREKDDFYECPRCHERRHNSNGGAPELYCNECFVQVGLEKQIRDLETRNAKLRRALSLMVLDISAERSWCQTCRTEGVGPLRGHDAHPHAPTCTLAGEAPGAPAAPQADAPFECWAVIRPDARGLSKAAAEAAAGPDDRVIHLVDFEALCELARAASDEACAGDGYSDDLADVMLRLGLIEASGVDRHGETKYRLTERFKNGGGR